MKASSFVGDFAHAQIMVKVQDPNYGRGSRSSEKKKLPSNALGSKIVHNSRPVTGLAGSCTMVMCTTGFPENLRRVERQLNQS